MPLSDGFSGAAVRLTLLGISLFAFYIRTFGVRKFEPVLNGSEGYRILRKLEKLDNGRDLEFDEHTWYPFGFLDDDKDLFLIRLIQAFRFTTGALWKTLTAHEACVYFGPFCGAVTPWISFFVVRSLVQETLPAICASFYVAVLPGFTFATVAGRLSSEALLPAIIFIFLHLSNKAMSHGCLKDVAMLSLLYYVSSSLWNEYFLLLNFAAIFLFCKQFHGGYNWATYISYSSFYGLSTCLTLSKSNFLTSEQFIPLFAFIYLQYYVLSIRIGDKEEIQRPLRVSFTSMLILLFYMKYTEIIAPLKDENAIYLNPSLQKTNPAVLTSSQSAQPSAWGALFFDNHFGPMLLPVGLSILSKKFSKVSTNITIYSVIALYLAAVKTSNQILLVPALSITSSIAISRIIELCLQLFKSDAIPTGLTKRQSQKHESEKNNLPMKRFFAGAAGTLCAAHLIYAARHGVWVTKNIYSDATIFVTASTGGSDGRALIFDDFRESYSWLKHNTPEDSKIAAWWDYGYQINQLAERGTLADNSASNKTSIAQIGKAFASNEEDGWSRLRHLGADYVYVTFGGQVGYSKDDINKFLWMLRIADSEHVTGEFNQKRYKNVNNEFRVDVEGAQTWLNSLLYKLSYYRYGGQTVAKGKATGWDRVRKAEIGNKDFELDFFEEVYTSQRWMVRLYRLKTPDEISISLY